MEKILKNQNNTIKKAYSCHFQSYFHGVNVFQLGENRVNSCQFVLKALGMKFLVF